VTLCEARMANGYEASPAAQVTWERVRGLLSVYYAAGMQGFGRSSWRQSLGARVQCSIDALGLLHLVLSADAAMTALRKCDVKAYTLAMKDIEEPGRPYHDARGLGTADRLGLTIPEAKGLFERAKACVWSQLEEEPACSGCSRGHGSIPHLTGGMDSGGSCHVRDLQRGQSTG